MCQRNYTDDNREVPCTKDNYCSLIGDSPFDLMVENRLAWDVYLDISSLSSPDANGLPTVDKIDFYFQYIDLELSQSEYEKLIEKLIFINNYRRYLLAEQIKSNGSQT